MFEAIITKANLKTFEVDFWVKVPQAALEDEEWIRRKEQLEYLEQEGKELPQQWSYPIINYNISTDSTYLQMKTNPHWLQKDVTTP